MTQSLQLMYFVLVLLEQTLKPHLCLKHFVKLGNRWRTETKWRIFVCLHLVTNRSTNILSKLSTPFFSEVRLTLSLLFYVVFCWPFSVFLSYLFWSLYFLSFFPSRHLITSVVSSSFSCKWLDSARTRRDDLTVPGPEEMTWQCKDQKRWLDSARTRRDDLTV